MNDNLPLGCTPQSTAIGCLLEALCADDTYTFVPVAGLPDGCVFVPERDALIAVTRAAAPLFRTALQRTAAALNADVVLLRVGEVEDALLPVSVDVALAALPCQMWVEHDLAPWTDGRSLWLVPGGFGASVSVTGDGFSVELVPPYETLAQRSAGIYRAQHMFACVADPVRVG